MGKTEVPMKLENNAERLTLSQKKRQWRVSFVLDKQLLTVEWINC